MITRSLVLMLLAGALMVLPLEPLGVHNAVEAQSCWPGARCPNGEFDVSALVSRIDVLWNGGSSYSILFNPVYNQTSGICGNMEAVPIQVYNASNGVDCGSANTSPTDVLVIDVDRSGCSGSFKVGYRFFHYLFNNSNLPRRVHSNVLINPNDFTQTGVFVQGYAPVPGC
jgi:hypothetical protein